MLKILELNIEYITILKHYNKKSKVLIIETSFFNKINKTYVTT